MAMTPTERQARYRAKHPEKTKAVAKRYYDANKEKCRQRCRDHHAKNSAKIIERNRWYKRKYLFGLTREAFGAILASQGNACATCGTATPPPKKSWHVDHCHATGKVRGILCHHCNTGIGLAKDDPEILRRWIKYLRKHSPPA